MPKSATRQLHIHDFTASEVEAFVKTSQGKLNANVGVIAPGEGRVRAKTAERVQEKMKALKEDSVAKLPASDQPSGLHLSFAIDKQTLDDWLRKEIADLPPIGKYAVVQPPRNPDVALRVRWED